MINTQILSLPIGDKFFTSVSTLVINEYTYRATVCRSTVILLIRDCITIKIVRYRTQLIADG